VVRYIVSILTNSTFRALAHPIRRGVIERLALGPATVGEATRGFGVSKPTITRHLHVLEEAGLVERDVAGRTHRLRLVGAPLTEAEAWLETQRARWERLFDAVEQYLDEDERGRRSE
jgi:DNA-binding transcriptional ArsR family regulator